jgi:3-methylfumaryl-CoA hydratase
LVPPGWHWAYFWAMSPREMLGADGLPVEDALLPKMPFPRRMFAGGKLSFRSPFRIGEPLRREIELTDIQLREGGSGQLLFVTSTQRIYGPLGLCVIDERHGVFRDEVPKGANGGIPKREPAPSDFAWRRTIVPDAVTLFRYSAVTFNPHRIHYDRTYAREVEGYPGLVVHGPFSQQCLLDLARDNNPGKVLTGLELRARAPLFDTAPFTVIGRPKGDRSCELWAVTPDGAVAVSATASFA